MLYSFGICENVHFFPSSCISQLWEGKGQYFFGKFDNLSENAQHTEGIEQLSYRVYE